MDRWAKYAISEGEDSREYLQSDQSRVNKYVNSCKILADKLGVNETSKLLDVGCGAGEFMLAVDGACNKYLGIDVSGDKIAIAKERVKTGHSQFDVYDITEGRVGELFDLVVSLTCLDHIFDKESALKNIHSSMEADGRCYIEVRNKDYLPKYIFEILSLNSRAVSEKYGDDTFTDLNESAWDKLIKNAGFEIVNKPHSIRPYFMGDVSHKIKGAIRYIVDRMFFGKRYMLAYELTKSNMHEN
ncbi:class I SAM-dependent methyltransferase [Pseudomonas sp. HK3]